jgi:hypothetical protein
VEFCETGKDELKASAAKAKAKGRPKGYNSDDEDKEVTEKEISFCKFVEECEEKVVVEQAICVCRLGSVLIYILLYLKAKALDPGEEVPQWGQQVFGCQVKLPYMYSVCFGARFSVLVSATKVSPRIILTEITHNS